MILPLYQIDSFTNTLFRGNPAAVVILEDWLTTDTMQAIAMENNLSETAFVKPLTDSQFAIRYFTPACEVPLCGHATLASGFIIFKMHPHIKQMTFITEEQERLEVNQRANGLLEMNFPKKLFTVVDNHIPTILLESLSIKPQSILINDQAYCAIYINEQDIYDLTVNSQLLSQLAPHSLVVSAPSKDYDYILRYFAPTHGIAEDPVTGSIQTGLTPYWASQLTKKQLRSYQASQRGGIIYTEEFEDRVSIAGHAVLFAQANIDLTNPIDTQPSLK